MGGAKEKVKIALLNFNQTFLPGSARRPSQPSRGVENSGPVGFGNVTFLHNFSHLNNSIAHIVIVAEDSGQPPRRASVPVVVRYERLIRSS